MAARRGFFFIVHVDVEDSGKRNGMQCSGNFASCYCYDGIYFGVSTYCGVHIPAVKKNGS